MIGSERPQDAPRLQAGREPAPTFFGQPPARFLLAILAAFAFLAALYAAWVPPFEGPDEAQHVAYITWLAEGQGFPPQGEAAWETPIAQEAGQPPLYYLLASLPIRLLRLDDPPAVYRENPYFPGPLPRDYPDNDNVAVHYPADTSPLRGGWLAIYMARGVTILFGLALVAGIYLTSREVIPRRPAVALGAAAFVAFLPQVLFIASVASNDIPAAALSALALWQFAALLRRGAMPGPAGRLVSGHALAAGAFLGLATLAKVSAAALAAPMALGLLWLWLAGRQPLRRVVVSGLWLALAALLVAGWWFARSWAIYGTPLGLESHDFAPWATPDRRPEASAGLRWLNVYDTFWVALGWSTLRYPRWVYLGLRALGLLAVPGLALGAWRGRRSLKRPDGAATAALLLLLALGAVAVGVGLEMWMRRVVAPYGRLMFPILAGLALFFVLGWRAWGRPVAALGLATTLALGALTPWLLIRPAYAPPRQLAAAEIAALPAPLGWRFAADGVDVAELLSVEPLIRSAAPVEKLPVRVCWRVLSQTERDYAIMLHLVGPDEWVAAARRTFPGLGHWPTSIWTPGAVFCDDIAIQIPDTIERNLTFLLEIGLLDPETLTRLSIRDAAGNPLDSTFVGRVRIALDGPPPPPPADPASAPAIELTGWETPTTWPPGSVQALTLTWGARAPVDRDFQVFIHLRDRPDHNAATFDGPPLNGWYGTSWWEANESVRDTHILVVPRDLAPGAYELVVGLYDLQSEARLGPEYRLTTIAVPGP